MKYEFASAAWAAFMHGLVVKAVAGLGDSAKAVRYSICEVFTNPPATLSPDGAPLAWHCIVTDGAVEFGLTDRADVGLRVVADYASILPIARYDTRGDPARAAELAVMVQPLLADGRLVMHGARPQPAPGDPSLGNLHDLIARVTA